jgi:hypothetical protein
MHSPFQWGTLWNSKDPLKRFTRFLENLWNSKGPSNYVYTFFGERFEILNVYLKLTQKRVEVFEEGFQKKKKGSLAFNALGNVFKKI